MQLKKLLLLILPLLMFSSCWLYHGDPPQEYESAYYAFVNETDQEIWIDCYNRSSSDNNQPQKVSWRIKVPPGEETSIFCSYMYLGDRYTVFHHGGRYYSIIYVYKNYERVLVRGNSENSLFLKSSYKKSESNDGKADFKYTYRFTEDFFKDAIYGRPGDLEDPKNVVGNTNN